MATDYEHDYVPIPRIPGGDLPPLDPEANPTDQWVINAAIGPEGIDYDLLEIVHALDVLHQRHLDGTVSDEEFEDAKDWLIDAENILRDEKDIPRP